MCVPHTILAVDNTYKWGSKMEDMNEDSHLVVEKKQPINGFFDEPGGLQQHTHDDTNTSGSKACDGTQEIQGG